MVWIKKIGFYLFDKWLSLALSGGSIVAVYKSFIKGMPDFNIAYITLICWTVGLITFCLAGLIVSRFQNKKSHEDDITDKELSNLVIPYSYFKFEIITKKIKGEDRYQINLLEESNVKTSIFSLLDIDGNLIIFFRIRFAGVVKEGCKHKIYKETVESDDFTQMEENNIRHVFMNVGLENYVICGAIAVQFFFTKGGKYKIDFIS